MIKLADIWSINNPKDYKIHFAIYNGEKEPLEAWVNNEWHEWQAHRPQRNGAYDRVWPRPYIFSLMRYYHSKSNDIWLFGGIWNVGQELSDRYEVSLSENMAEFIGRLKIRYRYPNQQRRVNFENHFNGLELFEILPERYSGQTFPGFDAVDISFEELETIVLNNRIDWKAALENTKGVYLISDIIQNKKYVGSAYGESGLWSRWSDYIRTNHGGNVELRILSKHQDESYFRKAMRFSILEVRTASTSDETIINREKHWKNILMTRGEFGLNRN